MDALRRSDGGPVWRASEVFALIRHDIHATGARPNSWWRAAPARRRRLRLAAAALLVSSAVAAWVLAAEEEVSLADGVPHSSSSGPVPGLRHGPEAEEGAYVFVWAAAGEAGAEASLRRLRADGHPDVMLLPDVELAGVSYKRAVEGVLKGSAAASLPAEERASCRTPRTELVAAALAAREARGAMPPSWAEVVEYALSDGEQEREWVHVQTASAAAVSGAKAFDARVAVAEDGAAGARVWWEAFARRRLGLRRVARHEFARAAAEVLPGPAVRQRPCESGPPPDDGLLHYWARALDGARNATAAREQGLAALAVLLSGALPPAPGDPEPGARADLLAGQLAGMTNSTGAGRPLTVLARPAELRAIERTLHKQLGYQFSPLLPADPASLVGPSGLRMSRGVAWLRLWTARLADPEPLRALASHVTAPPAF